MPGMNNIHCLQVTGGESMAKTYYYMVRISYPFLAESKEAAIQRADEATKIRPGKHISGHFTLRHLRQPYYFFLYEFFDSIPANKAKITDFVVEQKKVEIRFCLPQNLPGFPLTYDQLPLQGLKKLPKMPPKKPPKKPSK